MKQKFVGRTLWHYLEKKDLVMKYLYTFPSNESRKQVSHFCITSRDTIWCRDEFFKKNRKCNCEMLFFIQLPFPQMYEEMYCIFFQSFSFLNDTQRRTTLISFVNSWPSNHFLIIVPNGVFRLAIFWLY